MQKVIRATERAKTQARRKNVMKRARADSEQRTLVRTQQNRRAKDRHSLIQAARIARREDWLLGPLAPRRDLGSSTNTYGAIHPRIVQDVNKHENIRDYCIAKGDRVVMVGEFPEKGLIGTVKSVAERAETCMVAGFNMVDVATPKFMLEESHNKNPVQTTEAPVPLSAVRLVYPLRDSETGTLRDVIVKKLERTPSYERKQGLDGRYIADTDPEIYIPFPKQEKEEEPPEHQIDTLRIEVEQKTWSPTLFGPPMPPSVIDELRNKYSIFRDRHDESWVRAREKRAAERAKAAIEKEELMMTPLEELKRLKKLEKSKTMEEPLNREILMGIGELMAHNNPQLIGVKEVPSVD
ncbi:hypothetical protein MMC29_004151 [Sticta canariensis]|nr:hypothetical protein [Sticta canariensis]